MYYALCLGSSVNYALEDLELASPGPSIQKRQSWSGSCRRGHPEEAGTPRIGLGLAALGRPGYINLDRAADIPDRTEQAMRGQAEKVLDAAWAQLYSGGVGPLEALLLPVLHTRLATRLYAARTAQSHADPGHTTTLLNRLIRPACAQLQWRQR